MKIWVALFITLSIWGPAFGQKNINELDLDELLLDESEGSKSAREGEKASIDQKDEGSKSQNVRSRNLNSFFKGKSSLKDPFTLRDPFKRPTAKIEKKKNFAKGALRDGVFTNIPTIEEVSMDKIRIIGVLVGKERRALAKVDGKSETIVLKEGMTLGKDSAELKAILPGGIVLVEKITNVYGEPEYLETVIPISEE